MKLLFPNDEHAPVVLADGAIVVGAAAGCAIRLAAPGIADRHCELLTKAGQTRVRPLTDAAATVLNGRQVAGEVVIKPGDLLLFGRIGCRVVASEQRSPIAPVHPAANAVDDDAGHTRERMAMPKHLLQPSLVKVSVSEAFAAYLRGTDRSGLAPALRAAGFVGLAKLLDAAPGARFSTLEGAWPSCQLIEGSAVALLAAVCDHL